MALPHYTKDKTRTGDKRYEPVYGNLFEVTLLPPGGAGVDPIIMQHVQSVSGLGALNPEVGTVEQKYKFSTRTYAAMPEATTADIGITFSMNLNDSNQMYLYKLLKDWYTKVYDPATGEVGLKQDYIGKVIIVQHNRSGDIFRKITLEDAYITGAIEMGELDYSSTDLDPITVTFRTDTWTEELA